MPRRERDYSAEYRRRKRANASVPVVVRRGHGLLPIGVARRLEAGELSAYERRRYAPSIARYEERYGPAGHHAGKRHRIRTTFGSEEEARAWAEENLAGVLLDYLRFYQVRGMWRIELLR